MSMPLAGQLPPCGMWKDPPLVPTHPSTIRKPMYVMLVKNVTEFALPV